MAATPPPRRLVGMDTDRRSPATTPVTTTNRLTVAGGFALLAIALLHALVFLPNPWWSEWLAGPLRSEELPPDALTVFWALPGSFVVLGALYALSVIATGRRGRTLPLHAPIALAVWAALCVWIVGPSGFLLLAVPVVLLGIASLRARA
jgi:hypothetical protein